MIHDPRHSISELWCGVCSSLKFDLDLGVILKSRWKCLTVKCKHEGFWGRWQANKYVGIDWRTDEIPPVFFNKRTVVKGYRQLYRAASLSQPVTLFKRLNVLSVPFIECDDRCSRHTAEMILLKWTVNQLSYVAKNLFDFLYSFCFACLSYSTILSKDFV